VSLLHTSLTNKHRPFFPFCPGSSEKAGRHDDLPGTVRTSTPRQALASWAEVGRAAARNGAGACSGCSSAVASRAHGPAPWLTRMQRGRSERMHDRLVLHDDWLGRHASTNSVACQGGAPALSTCPSGRLPGPCSPPRRADKTVLKSAIGCAPSVNHGCAPARRGPQAAVHGEQSPW